MGPPPPRAPGIREIHPPPAWGWALPHPQARLSWAAEEGYGGWPVRRPIPRSVPHGVGTPVPRGTCTEPSRGYAVSTGRGLHPVQRFGAGNRGTKPLPDGANVILCQGGSQWAGVRMHAAQDSFPLAAVQGPTHPAPQHPSPVPIPPATLGTPRLRFASDRRVRQVCVWPRRPALQGRAWCAIACTPPQSCPRLGSHVPTPGPPAPNFSSMQKKRTKKGTKKSVRKNVSNWRHEKILYL